MTTPAPSERNASLPFGTVVLLVLAALFYCGMLGSLAGYRETDASGRGAALAFAAIFGVALWLVLALLMTIAAVSSRMSPLAWISTAALLPLSAIAASVAIDLYGSGGNDWALAVPVMLPLLIAASAVGVRLPGLHGRPVERWAIAGLGGAMVVLTMAPLVVSLVNALPNSARAARQAAAQHAQEERLKQEEQLALKQEAERFAGLGPDSSLGDFLPYFPGGDSRSREALEAARLVKSRQADAVALLKQGRINGLTDLFRLDLQVTPEICQAYGEALAAEAAKITRDRPDHLSVAIQLEQQLPNIQWLVDGGCNLNDALGILSDHLRAVSDSARLENFATTLAGLRR